MFLKQEGIPTGLLFHSDQGSHYTSRQFRQLLWKYQLKHTPIKAKKLLR
ncbi:DDE-type integrase/transposase/recombinase [Thorsellia anophelis]